MRVAMVWIGAALAIGVGAPIRAEAPPASPLGPAKAAAKKDRIIRRGAALSGGKVVPFADLVGRPDDFAGKSIATRAPVRAVCTRKGCWMELGEASTPGVRVTFKDYGFFVPRDSDGCSATVEGEVSVNPVDAKEAEHLESEGATVPRGKDGKLREIRLVATGVELVRP